MYIDSIDLLARFQVFFSIVLLKFQMILYSNKCGCLEVKSEIFGWVMGMVIWMQNEH